MGVTRTSQTWAARSQSSHISRASQAIPERKAALCVKGIQRRTPWCATLLLCIRDGLVRIRGQDVMVL